jgi:hypothetical protein
MEKRKDDRDARKSDDIEEYPRSSDETQQPAELQIGEDRERENMSRFEPGPQSRPNREKGQD